MEEARYTVMEELWKYATMNVLGVSLLGPANGQLVGLVTQLMSRPKYLDCSLMRDSVNEAWLSGTRTLSKRSYEAMCLVCFKLLRFRVICYTAAGAVLPGLTGKNGYLMGDILKPKCQNCPWSEHTSTVIFSTRNW